MSGRRVGVHSDNAVALEAILKEGVRAKPDVAALASVDTNKLCVLVWHYHDDDVRGPDAAIDLTLQGVNFTKANLEHFRIDQEHSNAFTTWLKLGSPPQPTAEQYAQLERAGRLATFEPKKTVQAENGRLSVAFKLPRQGVSLLVFTYRE